MLKKELNDQFLPYNIAWVTRNVLKNLQHTGTVKDYMEKFSSLILDIKNMFKEDKHFNFISGLQIWAQVELRRQRLKGLPIVIAIADSLVNF